MKNKDSRIQYCLWASVMMWAASILSVTMIAPCFAEEETVFRELARKMQNPVSDRLSFSLVGDLNFGVGLNEDTQSIIKIKSLKSFNLGDNWNLATRPVIPVVYQPERVPGSGDQFGLGDISTTFFLMPRSSRFAIAGIGPIVVFPSATDKTLGFGKWGVGPALAVVSMPGSWIFGVLANNVWSVGGNANREDVDLMTLKPFVFYNFPSGWYLVSSPSISAVWTAESGNRWIVPVGGGAGKIFNRGEQKINLFAQVFYNVEQTTAIGDWSLSLQLQYLFPD
jgi:hypothetical protein